MSQMMNREEVIQLENGIFESPFNMFENIVDEVNKAMSSLGKSIQFSVINNYEFNAHARKLNEKTYTIQLQSGIVPITLEIIADNVDFFLKQYPELENKETSLALGCIFVWTQIFTHELGHIIRGHVDIVDNELTNLVDDTSQMSMVDIPNKSAMEQDQIRMLMEFDADIFSSYFVAKIIINTIKTAQKEIDLEEPDKTIVGLAITSMFFFFNDLCKREGKSTKYPPAMVRINAIHIYIIKYLSGKISLSDDELSKVMKESYYDAYSFLVDENDFGQSLKSSELEHLYRVEKNLVSKYSLFTELISNNVILKYAGME